MWNELAVKWKSAGVKLIGYFGAHGEALDGFGHNYIIEVDDVEMVRKMDDDIVWGELGKYIEKLARWLGGFQTLIGVISVIVAIWVFIDTGVDLDSVFLLIVGFILAVSVMSALPMFGKYIAKLVKALGAFQVVIDRVITGNVFISITQIYSV